MDTVKFIKEHYRMCHSKMGCHNCEISKEKAKSQEKCSCSQWVFNNPERAVEITEKWSAEHPQKTMMQDFFEKFPNAQKRSDGLPSTCPFALGYCEDSRCPSVGNDFVSNCLKCWSRPLEE